MSRRTYMLIAFMLAGACGTASAPEAQPSAETAPGKLVLPSAAESTADADPSGMHERHDLSIWLSPALGLRSVDDAASRLDATHAFGFGGLAHDGQIRMPKTCRERETLRASGFEPETMLEARSDASAAVPCGTLHLLTHARPAQVSFLPGTLDDSLLAVLPATVATAMSALRIAERAAATRAGKSLRDFEPHARTTLDADGTPVIVETGLGTSVGFELQARADFDGDGTEDMAVAVLNSDDLGSYRETRLLVMTRKAQTAMLNVMR